MFYLNEQKSFAAPMLQVAVPRPFLSLIQKVKGTISSTQTSVAMKGSECLFSFLCSYYQNTGLLLVPPSIVQSTHRADAIASNVPIPV